MAKKALTTVQKKNRARTFQYLAFAGEFVSVLAPFVTLGIINYEEWFTTEEGFKVGIGAALTLALMGIAMWLITSKHEKKSEITNGWISFLIGWFAVAFIFLLLSSIMHQIFSIMMWGGIGIAGAFGLDMLSKDQKKKYEYYKSIIQEVKDEDAKEVARAEFKKDKEGLL